MPSSSKLCHFLSWSILLLEHVFQGILALAYWQEVQHDLLLLLKYHDLCLSQIYKTCWSKENIGGSSKEWCFLMCNIWVHIFNFSTEYAAPCFSSSFFTNVCSQVPHLLCGMLSLWLGRLRLPFWASPICAPSCFYTKHHSIVSCLVLKWVYIHFRNPPPTTSVSPLYHVQALCN